MNARDAITALAALHRHQLVVASIGAGMHEWHHHFGDADSSFHMHSMGLGSSFGIGLALAQPDHEVWVLEGDGGLALNLGTLLTLASTQPPNMKYFLVCNRRYGIIDGPAWVGADRADFSALARAAGVTTTYHVTDDDDLTDICRSSGFAFVVLDVEAGGRTLAHADYEGAEIKYRFARHVAAVTGRAVLGDHGY